MAETLNFLTFCVFLWNTTLLNIITTVFYLYCYDQGLVSKQWLNLIFVILFMIFLSTKNDYRKIGIISKRAESSRVERKQTERAFS